MKNLAIIPARSGSKGVKDKNIRNLCGKPLMAYTIKAAKESGLFDEVMVSTDSEVYAEVAEQYGASVPFLRSAGNSTDKASSWDMVDEVLHKYAEAGQNYDSFCLLQPTSPLRTAEDIKAAYQLFSEKAEIAVVSVCPAEHSPLWCAQLPGDMSLEDFVDRWMPEQRQGSAPYYRLNGAIYIVNTLRFAEDHFVYRKGSYAYLMDALHSVDIDTEMDFWMTEFLLEKIGEQHAE